MRHATGAMAEPNPAKATPTEDPKDRGYYGSGALLVVSALVLAFYLIPKLLGGGGSSFDGKAAPSFHAEYTSNAPDGASEVSLSNLKGKVVLIDFWATWCPPCRAEAPVMDRLYTKYKSQNVAVVGINTDDQEGNAAAYATAQHLNFPIAYDRDHSAANAYEVASLPTLVVLSRSGNVVAKRTGRMSEADLEALLQKAMEQP